MAIDTNVFPLFPQAATQTVTVTTAAHTLDITGRVVTLDVASGEDGVATLKALPAGLMFTLVAGTIAGGATIVITSNDGATTETFDATGEAVTLMALENGAVTVVAPAVADTTS